MPNLSPGFSARFASIGLEQEEQQSKCPKKPYDYPAGLHSTPSKAPRLSTAARAKTRVLTSKGKSQELVQTVHKRNLQLSRNTSPPAEREKQQKKYPGMPSLSFMRDTSSSRKKQSTAGSGFPQMRSTSNSEVYSRRTRLQTLMKNRQQSQVQPEEDDMEIDFCGRPTVFSSAPSSRILSPAHYLTQEYMKLYNTTSKPAFNLPRERSRRNLQTERLPRTSSKNNLHQPPKVRLQKSMSHGNLRPSPEHSHIPKSKSNLGIKLMSKKPAASDNRLRKPSTVSDIYKLIHRADPSFFRETNSLDRSLQAVKSFDAIEVLNSAKGKALNMYERGEIIRNSNIYYIPEPLTPHEVSPDVNISNFKDNYGFDDADGNYIVKARGHIEYRYEIISTLGTGSFGNVVFCKDHKYHGERKSRYVAIKIIKNDLNWSLQAVSEIKMLKHLTTSSASTNIMTYCDHFHFRGHMCIVTEALSLNLYTFLELGQLRGLSLGLVKKFMYQILSGIQFIHNKNVIHCDIKPENIMVNLPPHYSPDTEYTDSDLVIKLIDFGSSCFEGEASFTYIQSRFYRAPEVILGALYSYPIDIWSLGCVCAELFTGTPLLPGKNELEQVALILEMFGAPASSYIVSERKRVLKQQKGSLHKTLKDPLATDPAALTASKMHADEKKLKRALLYSLFNAEAKINLQFLNLQLQSMDSHDTRAPSPFKRNVKLNSRSIDIALRLASSGESKREQADFSRFMTSIFQWNPRERATVAELLSSRFLEVQKSH